jgi:aminoglycoside 6'-N-acetyltransferase
MSFAEMPESALPLRGERVTLRLPDEADLPRMLQILLLPGVSEWWPGYSMPRLRSEALEATDAETLVIEREGEVVGLLMYAEEPDPQYKSASIDIALDTGHIGQGLGTDALRTLARHLFGEGHHRLTIDPALANERAIAAYRKVGFKPVGVMREYEMGADGSWHDNLLMELLADELQ